ncbi:interferon omega-2-like [Pteronotus mesoamericanus]|uniref:interferon omega-2-like n=1 Tax=Pteronotus mesoamericanus TaxID=1884717 RepID=UPI0023EB98A3|nr:interferon omega-2-like [Pteronotus parnellii mesoamericanus]XP_054440057.1 interferon omega-2-like [Pteronotus parnellii mesoamericanus]
MALLLSLLTALVVISCGPGGSLGCDLPQSHILLSKENALLFRRMWRNSTSSCPKDGRDLRLPRAMVNGSQVQKAQPIAVLHEMLRHISDLLLTEHASAAWDTTLLNQLRMGLHRQLADLEPCLKQETEEEGAVPPTQGPTLAVRRYFEGLCRYLKDKKYSDCAWDRVQVEILKSWSSILNLTRHVK